jgi:hypothetical protein
MEFGIALGMSLKNFWKNVHWNVDASKTVAIVFYNVESYIDWKYASIFLL